MVCFPTMVAEMTAAYGLSCFFSSVADATETAFVNRNIKKGVATLQLLFDYSFFSYSLVAVVFHIPCIPWARLSFAHTLHLSHIHYHLQSLA